jgi:glutathione peroxidase
MTTILIKIISAFLINFYSLSFVDINGTTINMSSYQGKKVLICNMATGSNKVNQLIGLQQLKQQFGDSLVVILFPSNSFGKESRTDAQIKQFVQSNIGTSLVIASKTNITGTTSNTIFTWLASKMQNGEVDGIAGGDFQKYLIGKTGNIIGVYSPKIKPTDPSIITTITSSSL